MTTWLNAVLQWLGKFSPRYAAGIAFLTGVLLFASDKILKYFDLDTFAHTRRGTIALVFEYAIFTLGHELGIPLRIRAKLAERLRNEAGNCWPVEET